MRMRTIEQLAVAKNMLSRLGTTLLRYMESWMFKGRCSSVVLPTSPVGFRGNLFLLEARRAPMRSPQPSPAVRASVTCREWEDSRTIIETCGKVVYRERYFEYTETEMLLCPAEAIQSSYPLQAKLFYTGSTQ